MKRIRNGDSEKSKRTKVHDYENMDGELGIIESVSLVNFMCHENLVFEFGPRINFVIGKNGSGKSALLTAIILALGGRSSVTGRYSNIRGFVLQGKQKAKIEITLRNCGSQAYKPDIYGDKIIVIREITCDGGSSYKIKSANGRIISQTKEELSKILVVMNIQVENPVSALTQESSRSFLTSKKPEKLYQFFYKGTGLESLEVGYNIIQHNKEEAVEELRRKKEMLPDLEKELRSLEKVLDTSSKVVDLKNELLWATIHEIEKRLQEKTENLNDLQSRIQFMEEEHSTNQSLISQKSADFDGLKNERDECDKQLETFREKLTELNKEKEELCSSLRFNQGKLSSLKRDEAVHSNEILNLQRSVTEKNLKNRNSFEEDEAQRKQEMEILNERRRDCSMKVAQMSEKRQIELTRYNEIKEEMDSIRPEINVIMTNKSKLERYEMNLQNQVNKFGHKTDQVLSDIATRSYQFKKLPLGPIGKYLHVKDPKWCSAVESCLSTNMLFSFCCDNNQDANVLKEILKRHYPENLPSIIVSKFLPKVHEGLNMAESSQYPTVLEMLEIENPVIANCLIDMLHIESKILIEDRKSGVEVMLESPPRNCFSAYLLDSTNIVLKPFRIYSSSKKAQRSMLASVQAGDTSSIKEEIQQLNLKKTRLLEREKTLKNAFNRIPKFVKELEGQIVEQNVQIKNISAKIRDLETTEDHSSFVNMEEDLEQLQAEYQKLRPEVLKYEKQVQECSRLVSDIQNEMGKYKSLLQKVTRRHQEICSLMNGRMQEQETLKETQNKLEDAIRILDTEKNPLETELEREAQNLQKRTDEALKIGPRIATKRNCEAVRRLLTETEKVVQQHSKCSREEMLTKYKEKSNKLKEAKEKLKLKEKNVQLIDEMYRRRRQNFRAVCLYTQTCVDMAYIVLIKKYFSGKLEFNNEKRLLKLEASKKDGPKPTGGGKCGSLSGGERSFITIAFLLAMWERIRTPFKILDEYDVFMDSNNRKLSIDLLIGQAKMMPDSQFIFLSPLELPQVKNDPIIKLLQMPAPKRNMGSMDVE